MYLPNTESISSRNKFFFMNNQEFYSAYQKQSLNLHFAIYDSLNKYQVKKHQIRIDVKLLHIKRLDFRKINTYYKCFTRYSNFICFYHTTVINLYLTLAEASHIALLKNGLTLSVKQYLILFNSTRQGEFYKTKSKYFSVDFTIIELFFVSVTLLTK